MTAIEPASREELVAAFSADRTTHLYALADLDEPFWSNSRWYCRDGAYVGIVSAGTGWMTGYAMATERAHATRALMADLSGELPPGSWITGPPGLADSFEGRRRHDPKGIHHRMILRDAGQLDDGDLCRSLGVDDLASIAELTEQAPGEVFFQASMLDGGCWHGVFEGGVLVAMAGTHVVSDHWGVAAIGGVLTRPSHRGRGLASKTTSAVARALAERVDLIGLNVSGDNATAKRVYERLGFRTELDFEEIEVL